MICRIANTKLMDLLADEGGNNPSLAETRSHVEQCAECKRELAALRTTMAALSVWDAPEPSPYFDARMSALLRAEREAAPAGFFERLRTRLLFSSSLHLRPVAAGALALLLLAGGGTYAGFRNTAPAPSHTSATVRDLQSLDENSQVFQQLNALDQQDDEDNGAPADNNL
jgi:anti-sigma factor RsiW